MNTQQISELTNATLDRLTGDEYKAAFEDAATGPEFAAKVEELANGPRSASRANARGDAAQTSFDPSFDEPGTATATATAPAPVKTDELPLLEHIYQPVDSAGRALGSPQRFLYRTLNDPNDEKSLVRQLTKAHMASTTRIRELSRARKIERS